jgi:hypothetical protein
MNKPTLPPTWQGLAKPEPETESDDAPLSDREILEGLLDELAGIRLVLVNHLRMMTISPSIRDHVVVDEDGVVSIPQTFPPLDPQPEARDARRAKFQAAIAKGSSNA